MSRFSPRFFTHDDLRRWRPAVLLALLPYFVFTLWASPLHLHSSDGREIPLSSLFSPPQSPSQALSPNPTSSTRNVSHDVSDGASHVAEKGADKSAGECFLCDWNASASSQIAVAAALPVPIERAQIAAFSSSQSLRFCRARVSRNRGPPSPLFFS